jgi:hypothetical protein
MEFKRDGWQVTIEGAADMPIRAMYDLYEGVDKSGPILARVVKSHNLTDWDGQPVTFVETRVGDAVLPTNVSPAQLKWLRECVQDAGRNELLDPEA